jgi:RNA polymerase sigma factor (sigma-70 family)
VCRTEDSPDEKVLEQFLSGGEFDSENAFRALVSRHGPMVLTTCRGVLNRVEDAEDAFQATFLRLARRGASIRDRSALGVWLRKVAYRIASTMRARAIRQRAVETQAAAIMSSRVGPEAHGREADWNELRPIVREEVLRLPEKYRIPVILSYLEGRTNAQVAELLQWPVGTVKGRLSRARQLLRSRLSRRGLALFPACLALALSQGEGFGQVALAGLVTRTVPLVVSLGLCALPSPLVVIESADAGDAAPADAGGILGLNRPVAPRPARLTGFWPPLGQNP